MIRSNSNRAALVGDLQNAVMRLQSAGVISHDHAARIEKIASDSLHRLENDILDARRLLMTIGHAISTGQLTEGRSYVQGKTATTMLVHPRSALRELHEKRVLKEYPWGAPRLLQIAGRHLGDLVGCLSMRAFVGGKRCRCIELRSAAMLPADPTN
jgi:hypothetical protein